MTPTTITDATAAIPAAWLTGTHSFVLRSKTREVEISSGNRATQICNDDRSLPLGLEQPITWLHRFDPTLVDELSGTNLANSVWRVLVVLLILITQQLRLRVWRQQMAIDAVVFVLL